MIKIARGEHAMLKNYMTIALRQLVKQKTYSAINIFGLAVGVACCLLIALYVKHELSYDRQYANADRIYRISRDFYSDDGRERQLLAANAPVVAELLKLDFPEIEQAARIYCCGSILASGPEGNYFESAYLADNELFEIFDFDWLRGDPATALVEPYTMVITESAARQYFGDADPMGKTLLVENQWPARVTGVLRDLPDNTHLQFRLLLSLPTAVAAFGQSFVEGWSSNNFHTYILLKPGADIATIEQQSGAFLDRHFHEDASRNTGFTAYPLTDIHLRSNRQLEISAPGSARTVYAFSAIALFVLMIACINFMSLATARASQRAREVGMRKALGASRSQIVMQFLGESVVVVSIAIVIALALVELALPAFNTFLGIDLALDYFGNPIVIPLLLALTLLVGVIAGSYPAFYLSAFDPARVLKGDFMQGNAAVVLRQLLVVAQFSISIALIIATIVVYSQMRFARDIDLGYDQDQIVVLSGSPTVGLGEQWESLKQRWLANPEIAHVTASRWVPGVALSDSVGIVYEGGPVDDRPMPFMLVDFDFFETYGIDVLAGRGFSEDFGADQMHAADEAPGLQRAGFVLNELAARQLGWTPQEAIGKWLEVGFFDHRGEVVGVVGNVLFESVHTAAKPLLFAVPPARMFGFPALRSASIKLTGRELERTLAYIDETWAEFMPDQPVNRRFLDENLEALYSSERLQAQLLTFFSIFAVCIACLGLLGLAMFTSERRIKEIGIRKVVGGNVSSIVKLLTAEFSKLVLLSNLIAWPVAYTAMSAWLDEFAYHIDLGPLVFVAGASLAFLIAWLTVGGVAAHAASIRPALALRTE